ncbi:MAG: hypothetical protein U9R15_15005 [Chloroflexota bacterium]|nr:hypothetical protein [Chloroflexota bacterium]
MPEQAITLHLPGHLYRQLGQAADVLRQTLDDVALQSIRAGLPPSLDRLPERFRADVRALGRLSDEVLWQVAHSDIDDDKAATYESLLEQNQHGELGKTDRARLNILREEADLLMLRRSYAYALLKWRGHHIPTFDKLPRP